MSIADEYPRCFACGVDNKRGLGLKFITEDNMVVCRFSLDEDFNGWPGVAHGGIVATVLDEAAYYAISLDDNWGQGLTINMNLDYKLPTPVNEPLLLQGWVEKNRRNILYCQTRLFRETDMKLLAQAEVSYLMRKKANA